MRREVHLQQDTSEDGYYFISYKIRLVKQDHHSVRIQDKTVLSG